MKRLLNVLLLPLRIEHHGLGMLSVLKHHLGDIKPKFHKTEASLRRSTQWLDMTKPDRQTAWWQSIDNFQYAVDEDQFKNLRLNFEREISGEQCDQKKIAKCL